MHQRGSVLILVMFVLVVLSLIAVGLTYRAGIINRSARHESISTKLEALSRSAVELALSDLANDTNDFDHWAEPWRDHPDTSARIGMPETLPQEGGIKPEYTTTYQVVDEDGKLNLLFASSEALETLGLQPNQIDAIFDWIDSDRVARAEGAEDEFYSQYPSAYRSKNAPPEILEELLLIRGISLESYWGEDLNHNRILDANENDGAESEPLDNRDGRLRTGLIDLITVLGDGKINLNTAPREVLATLPITDEAVDQIMGFRSFDRNSRGGLEDHAFRSVEDINTLNGLSDVDRDVLTTLCKFSSDFYQIRVQSTHRSTGLRHRLQVLVFVSETGPGVMQWSQP